ncbi:MAG: ATP-binding protein, partial [Verrucomicrobiota bacterium]|nr:ATP-binding protein [Verrucomicrobiota bacterium]
RKGDTVEITVKDYGEGVPEDCLPQLFDPFFRPEPSRSRETGGTGLGLAIVKSAIEACSGEVRCRNHSSGGLEFCLRLPAAD